MEQKNEYKWLRVNRVIEKKVGHFSIPYTHTNWTALSRIGPQPRKSIGNLGSDSSDFKSFWC